MPTAERRRTERRSERTRRCAERCAGSRAVVQPSRSRRSPSGAPDPPRTGHPVALGMGADLSTSGDYASDVLGDPWDFSNDEDVHTPPGDRLESQPSARSSRHRLLGDDRRRPAELRRRGRLDGQAACAPGAWSCRGAATAWPRRSTPGSTRISALSNCPPPSSIAIQFVNDAGPDRLHSRQTKLLPGSTRAATCASEPRRGPARSSRSASVLGGGRQRSHRHLDWVRLHRADTPAAPPAGVTDRSSVVTPERRGWRRLRHRSRQPVGLRRRQRRASPSATSPTATFANGELTGTTSGNDSFVELPLRTPFIPDSLPPCHRRRLLTTAT